MRQVFTAPEVLRPDLSGVDERALSLLYVGAPHLLDMVPQGMLYTRLRNLGKRTLAREAIAKWVEAADLGSDAQLAKNRLTGLLVSLAQDRKARYDKDAGVKVGDGNEADWRLRGVLPSGHIELVNGEAERMPVALEDLDAWNGHPVPPLLAIDESDKAVDFLTPVLYNIANDTSNS